MASNLKIGVMAANTQANALINFCGNGTIVIYQGAQATGTSNNTSNSSANTLATLVLNATPFTLSSGVLTANPIANVTISASGTAAWFRCYSNAASGSVALFDGSVGTSGSDLNLNSVALSSGATLAVSSFSFTVPSNP